MTKRLTDHQKQINRNIRATIKVLEEDEHRGRGAFSMRTWAHRRRQKGDKPTLCNTSHCVGGAALIAAGYGMKFRGPRGDEVIFLHPDTGLRVLGFGDEAARLLDLHDPERPNRFHDFNMTRRRAIKWLNSLIYR